MVLHNLVLILWLGVVVESENSQKHNRVTKETLEALISTSIGTIEKGIKVVKTLQNLVLLSWALGGGVHLYDVPGG